MVSISLGFPYLVMLQTFKRKRHCSGCGVAMGCYGRCIVPDGAVIILSPFRFSLVDEDHTDKIIKPLKNKTSSGNVVI